MAPLSHSPLSSLAGKRLLLVIDRPGAFPEVVDVAPGTHAVVALRGKIDEPIAPEPPGHPEQAPGRSRMLALAIILTALAGITVVLSKLRKASRGKAPGS